MTWTSRIRQLRRYEFAIYCTCVVLVLSSIVSLIADIAW